MKNKKLSLIIGGIIVFIMVVSGFYYFSHRESSSEELFKIVKPEIDNYCSEIKTIFNENANDFSIICATCGSVTGGGYKEVGCEELENHLRGNYCVSKESEGYTIKVIVPLAWGGYNNKPGSSPITFTLNKNKQIVNKEILKESCMK